MPSKTVRIQKRILKRIADRHGQGHGDAYKAWIQVTRANITNKSCQSAGNTLNGYKRRFNFMSQSERRFSILLQWLGAADIREQFPLWPVPHLHPLVGARGSEGLGLGCVRGLLEIAKEAGIDHGYEIEARGIPYVATVDLMVTIYRQGVPSLVAFSCKPREIIESAGPLDNPLRRAELERRYMHEISGRFVMANPERYPRALYLNLEWLMPDDAVSVALEANPGFVAMREYLAANINDVPIEKAIRDGRVSANMDSETANAVFRLLAWRQQIDIDLSRPVAMSRPACRGGKSVYHALRNGFGFGGCDVAC